MATVVIDSAEFTVYADIEDADAYALGSMNATAWNALTEQAKAIALVTATRIFDRQSWIGEKTDTAQPLAWPRKNTGCPGIEDDVIPTTVINASIELAFSLAAGSDVESNPDQSQEAIQRLKAGSVEIQFFRGATSLFEDQQRFPQPVEELLKLPCPLLAGGADLAFGAKSYGTDGKTVTSNTFKLNRGY